MVSVFARLRRVLVGVWNVWRQLAPYIPHSQLKGSLASQVWHFVPFDE